MKSLGVHTSEVYKSGFTFPQIALNDFAVEQIKLLQSAEEKLNSDPENSQSLDNFIQTANKVSEALLDRYSKQWISPRGEQPPARSKLKLGGTEIPVNYDEEPYEVDLNAIDETEGLEKIETAGSVYDN